MANPKTLLRDLTMGLLALLLVFEEWGWEPLARSLARLARLPLWAAAERWIQALPRWAALLVFVVPMLALLPIKLLALVLFGSGHRVLGLLLLLGAKLLGTAVVARLFQLTKPALMQFGWFARSYPRWQRWKDGLTHWIRSSPVWVSSRAIKARVLAWWQAV